MSGGPASGAAEIGRGQAGVTGAATQPKLTVRLATPADLETVVALLSERDGHRLDLAHVSTALYGLEPGHLAAWIAFVGDAPAGLACLYLREQRWGSTEADGRGCERTLRMGYWAHLFVREEFRRLMVYPSLVLAMMRGIKPLGIDGILTGTRRAHVAEAHVKLGFAKLGELAVMFKPLRPFRLVARYKGLPGVATLAAAPGDAAYGAFLAARRGGTGELTFREAGFDDAALGTLVRLLNDDATGRVSEPWTVKALRRRLAGAIDGHRYHVLFAERSGTAVGASVFRMAERDRVAAGIVMELVGASGTEVLKPLVGEIERRLREAGADTTLYLDGLGPGVRGVLQRAGHRTSKETYQMLVWPKTLVPPGSAAADLLKWRFSFLDHDAF